MKVSMSLEMWMQCGPSHVKCGCNVDPPHLHILKVDVMWSNVDVLWSNVDFHISNVNALTITHTIYHHILYPPKMTKLSSKLNLTKLFYISPQQNLYPPQIFSISQTAEITSKKNDKQNYMNFSQSVRRDYNFC